MVFGNKLGINIALLSCWSQLLNLYWEVAREIHGELERQQKANMEEDRNTGEDEYSSPPVSIPTHTSLARVWILDRPTDKVSLYEREGFCLAQRMF